MVTVEHKAAKTVTPEGQQQHEKNTKNKKLSGGQLTSIVRSHSYNINWLKCTWSLISCHSKQYSLPIYLHKSNNGNMNSKWYTHTAHMLVLLLVLLLNDVSSQKWRLGLQMWHMLIYHEMHILTPYEENWWWGIWYILLWRQRTLWYLTRQNAALIGTHQI